jgi:serine/threonine protein kinase
LLATGSRLGHYEVTGSLGAGGMGEVYRATDTRLGREVAIKVLPPEVAVDPARLERFRREAKALAALDHPGIVTVYSVEEEAGIHFLTMQLVEGQPLSELIPARGLELERVREIGTALAQALAAAHEKGIVHRDLKPANVMVTRDARVKILDFGLAKVTASASSPDSSLPTETPTSDGVVMGTVPYMSPEQVQGRALDHRSDIYSLGAVLYEMATGRRPFDADSPAGLMSAILRDAAPSVASLRSDVPAELERVVSACLQKDPGARPKSALEIFTTPLGRPGGTSDPAAPRIPVVVVLPFVNRSPDPGNDYFSDGLTEEVITDLARIEALRVISRNSAMALKGATRDTPSIARELNVTHVVSGSVRMAGEALRVTVELVEAARDTPIWSDKYSGTLADVFGIQEEIARKIVAALKVKLTPFEERHAGQRPIQNVVAYDAYLRARQEMYHWTPESSRRAHRLVEEARAVVGDAPLLLATKGQLHWNEVNTNLVSAEEGLAQAAALVARALALDPDLSLAIYVRGLVAGSRGQLEVALPDLYRAHGLAPNDANMLAEVIRFSNVAGLRHHGTIVDHLVAIDPLTPITLLCVSSYHWVNGNWVEMAAAARRSIELAQEPSMLHAIAGWQIASAGHREEAAAILHRTAQACAGKAQGPWTRFLDRAVAGDGEAALGQATALEGAVSNEFAARMIAEAFALLGRDADALRWLRTAIRLGFVNHPALTEHAPFLARLRDRPEFHELMGPVKERWQALVEWERQHRAGGRGEAR